MQMKMNPWPLDHGAAMITTGHRQGPGFSIHWTLQNSLNLRCLLKSFLCIKCLKTIVGNSKVSSYQEYETYFTAVAAVFTLLSWVTFSKTYKRKGYRKLYFSYDFPQNNAAKITIFANSYKFSFNLIRFVKRN